MSNPTTSKSGKQEEEDVEDVDETSILNVLIPHLPLPKVKREPRLSDYCAPDSDDDEDDEEMMSLLEEQRKQDMYLNDDDPFDFRILCAEREGPETAALTVTNDYEGSRVHVDPYEFERYDVMLDTWFENKDYLSPDLSLCQRTCVDRCDTVIAFQSSQYPDRATFGACQYALRKTYDPRAPKWPRIPIDNVQVVEKGKIPIIVFWDIDQHDDDFAFELACKLARWLGRMGSMDLFVSGVPLIRYEAHVHTLLMRTFRYWETKSIHVDQFPPSMKIGPQHFLNLPTFPRFDREKNILDL